MNIGRVFKEDKELIMQLLLYGSFSLYMISHAVSAIKAVRKINREGIKVPAEVIWYSESNHKIGRLTEKLYHVTVSCIDPRTNTMKTFTLTTNSGKGKRYSTTKIIDVIFMENQEILPILLENLNTAKRVRYTALFGGIFCVLFSTLLMICIIDISVDGRVSDFLHEKFFS